MKKYYMLFSLCLFFSACKKNDYDEFEMTYDNTFETFFSIKFTQSDTVYIRERWSPYDNNDKVPYPKSNTNYIAVIPAKQKEAIIEYVGQIDFKKFDSLYSQNYLDGTSYRFYIKTPQLEKKIIVRSLDPPKELDSLAAMIVEMKRHLILKKTDKNLEFKTGYNTPSPPPPPNF